MIRSSKKTRTKASLVIDADCWVKAIVNNRQQGACLCANHLKPSCGGPLQGCHILRKGGMYRSLRYDLENVVVMCRNHHLFWAHLYEHDFYEWIEQIYPGRIARLKETALHHRKVDLKELICVLKDIYQKELRESR